MSIKGFPSSQKLPLGTGYTNDFVTIQPTDEFRYGLDIPRFAFRVDNALVPRTAQANTGNIDGLTWIYDTATPAKKGDFIRFESGANQYIEVAIVAVETNRFLLGAKLTGAAPGDTFYIMRYATQRVDETGSQVVIASPGPSQYVLDGADTEVEEDTVTPANNKPFPVKLFSSGNVPLDYNAGNASAQTIRAVLATDQPAVLTKESLNTGSFAQITNLINVAQTFTAPANAVGFKIQAPSTNTENIAWSQGSVATITAGFLMEPGRSEDFDAGSNISVIATSASAQTVTVIWKVRT